MLRPTQPLFEAFNIYDPSQRKNPVYFKEHFKAESFTYYLNGRRRHK